MLLNPNHTQKQYPSEPLSEGIFFLNSPDITEVCILKLAALVIFLHHLRHCFQQAVSVILIQLPKASLRITPPSKCGRAAAHSPCAGQVSSRARGSFCHLCPGLPAGNEQSRKASAQLALLLHVSLCWKSIIKLIQWWQTGGLKCSFRNCRDVGMCLSEFSHWVLQHQLPLALWWSDRAEIASRSTQGCPGHTTGPGSAATAVLGGAASNRLHRAGPARTDLICWRIRALPLPASL